MKEKTTVEVRALASHQCVPGSIPGPGVICGLNLLLVLYSAPRGFSPGTPVFPSPQKPTFPNSNSILECTAISERVLWAPWYPVGKQITFTFFLQYMHTERNITQHILDPRPSLSGLGKTPSSGELWRIKPNSTQRMLCSKQNEWYWIYNRLLLGLTCIVYFFVYLMIWCSQV